MGRAHRPSICLREKIVEIWSIRSIHKPDPQRSTRDSPQTYAEHREPWPVQSNHLFEVPNPPVETARLVRVNRAPQRWLGLRQKCWINQYLAMTDDILTTKVTTKMIQDSMSTPSTPISHQQRHTQCMDERRWRHPQAPPALYTCAWWLSKDTSHRIPLSVCIA